LQWKKKVEIAIAKKVKICHGNLGKIALLMKVNLPWQKRKVNLISHDLLKSKKLACM
jgi:hypothetical protein